MKSGFSLWQKISALIVIVFGGVMSVGALAFLPVFFSTSKSFFESSPSILGLFGTLFITSGFLYVALAIGGVGALFIILGIQGWRRPSNRNYLVLVVIGLLVGVSMIRGWQIDKNTDAMYQQQALEEGSKKIVDSQIIQKTQQGFTVVYQLEGTTPGYYLLRSEVTEEGYPSLYYTETRTELTADSLTLSENFLFSEIFNKCAQSSKNLVCVGLTAPNAGVQGITVTIKHELLYLGEKPQQRDVEKTIPFPQYKTLFQLDKSSKLGTIRLAP